MVFHSRSKHVLGQNLERVTCTLHQILLGWSSQGICDGRGDEKCTNNFG